MTYGKSVRPVFQDTIGRRNIRRSATQLYVGPFDRTVHYFGQGPPLGRASGHVRAARCARANLVGGQADRCRRTSAWGRGPADRRDRGRCVVHDGATWSRIPGIVRREHWLGLVVAPRHASFVSLRTEARDMDGRRVEQTILRAYGLRG